MKQICFLVLSLLVFIGCTDSPQQASRVAEAAGERDSLALNVAVMPTLDCLPVYVAAECGLFDAEQVGVSLHRFMAQMDCDTALVGGSVDGLLTDLVRAERMGQQGLQLHYALSTRLSWQLLSAKTARISQLKQLDDKMLAMTRFSATAMLADQLVDSVGLKSERVFRIQVNDVGVRLSMLENNVMDAMFLPEPQATVARTLDSRMLYDSRQDSMRLGVLAFTQQTMNDSVGRQRVEAFLRAYALACDSIDQRGIAHYRDVLAKYCGVQPSVADSLPADIVFGSRQMPRQADIDRVKAWLNKK